MGVQWRSESWHELSTKDFDVLVVGGGITGAGVARDAALRGLSVALVDKGDFASGTSSRSSRLVHGGLRYLETYEFGLVFESTHERARLMKLAPHLVRPLPFLVPLYEGEKPGPGLLRLGMLLYDTLASFRNYRRHRKLKVAELREQEPQLLSEGLRGGFRYYDCETNDGRLTLENVLGAREASATCLNYARFVALRTEGDSVVGATVQDELSGERAELRAKVVVNAVGPWLRELGAAVGGNILPDLSPSKGVHIVLPRTRLPVQHAVVMKAAQDGRVVFCIPWGSTTYVGTTDTAWEGNPDEVAATAEDVRYLLDTTNRYFPELALSEADVMGTWAGLRPLVVADSTETKRGTYRVSREHLLERDPRGVVTITGGKLTTYRIMAAQTVDEVIGSLRDRSLSPARLSRCQTKRLPLPGGIGLRRPADRQTALAALSAEFAERPGLDTEAVLDIFERYGARARALLELAAAEPALAAPIARGLPYRWAELRFAAETEMVTRLEDMLVRRTYLFYKTPDRALSVAREVAARLGACLGWDDERIADELSRYRALAESSVRFLGH